MKYYFKRLIILKKFLRKNLIQSNLILLVYNDKFKEKLWSK